MVLLPVLCSENKLLEWNSLVARVVNVTLYDERDTFFWLLKPNGPLTENSMYLTPCQQRD